MNSKQALIILAGILITAVGLAAISTERMKTKIFCNDVRVAMDGGFAASIEVGGLKPRAELSIYKKHVNGKTQFQKKYAFSVIKYRDKKNATIYHSRQGSLEVIDLSKATLRVLDQGKEQYISMSCKNL